ncbi:MAG: pilin [Candidatus Paceibacterota bacterium]
MKKTFYLYSIVLIILFGSVLCVQAVDLELPAFTTASSSIAGMINQIYIYALSIAGVLAIVMIVYGGISYALDPGNASKQGDAKDIMQSAIWGIVLLAGAYVILKTINPDLVQLRELPLEHIELSQLDITNAEENPTVVGTSPGGTSIGCTTLNTDIQKTAQLAKDFLALGPRLTAGSCDKESGLGTGSSQIINAVINGTVPAVCNWKDQDKSCSACALGGPGGKTTVCPSVLKALVATQTGVKNNTIQGFTVTSITGGLHGANSGHYQGRKIDVVPFSKDIAQWKKIGEEFAKNGGSVFCEAEGVYATLAKCPDNIGNRSNAHLDIAFGGAGTPESDPADVYGYALRKELSVLAKQYLALNPNLLSDTNFGIPSASGQKACSYWPRSSAQGVINDTAAEQIPFVCNGSSVDFSTYTAIKSWCGCSPGGTNGKVILSKNALVLLIDLETQKKNGKLPNFQVVTLTGGIQIGDDFQSHYSGVGIDIVPVSTQVSDWNKIMKYLKDKGYSPSYQNITVNSLNDSINSSGVSMVIENQSMKAPTCLDSSKLVLVQGTTGPTCPVGSLVCCFAGRIHVTAFDK